MMMKIIKEKREETVAEVGHIPKNIEEKNIPIHDLNQNLSFLFLLLLLILLFFNL